MNNSTIRIPYLLILGLSSACVTPKTTVSDTSTGDTGSDSGTDSGADSGADSGTDSGTDSGSDTSSDSGSDTATNTCGAPTDAGSFSGTIDASLVTSSPPSNDAGLSAVFAQAPTTDGTTATVDIQVTDAVVSNVGYFPSGSTADEFWLEDQSGAVEIYLVDSGSATLAAGDLISMHVTSIENYAGGMKVTGGDSITIDDSAPQSVYVHDGHAEALSYGSLTAVNVDVWGTISAALGACGGSSSCYTLTTDGGDVALRTSKTTAEGDCIHGVVPLGYFNGEQLDISDYDWIENY